MESTCGQAYCRGTGTLGATSSCALASGSPRGKEVASWAAALGDPCLFLFRCRSLYLA